MAVTLADMLLRLGAAFVAGLILGIERESRGRPAGLRTTALVCVAAALAALLSELWFISVAATGTDWRPDPARLAAGVLTGMGFLGAGTILRRGDVVQGVTTAAVLWYVTLLGLAFGSGQFALGLIGLGLALVIVLILYWIDRVIEGEHFASLTLTTTLEAATGEAIRQEVESFGVRVLRIEMEYDLQLKQRALKFKLEFRQRQAGEVSQRLVDRLIQQPGVLKVKWS